MPPADQSEPSRSLFVDIAGAEVDPAYIEAAVRRGRGRRPGAGPGRRPGVSFLAVLVALGLLLTIAAQTTRRRAPVAARTRTALSEEAGRRTAATDRLRVEYDRLRQEVAGARDSRLRASATGRGLAARVRDLELATAAVPVTGRGMVVELADAPGADEPGGPGRDGVVRDRDLQLAVNALWAAGAEAVAVNGRRLSATTAIREAGAAILVDYRPVSGPYAVEAIGDPDQMEPAFAVSAAAERLRLFRDTFGLGFDVRRAERLVLPGVEASGLRHARPATGAR